MREMRVADENLSSLPEIHPRPDELLILRGVLKSFAARAF
jgi:hypothetical protein